MDIRTFIFIFVIIYSILINLIYKIEINRLKKDLDHYHNKVIIVTEILSNGKEQKNIYMKLEDFIQYGINGYRVYNAIINIIVTKESN